MFSQLSFSSAPFSALLGNTVSAAISESVTSAEQSEQTVNFVSAATESSSSVDSGSNSVDFASDITESGTSSHSDLSAALFDSQLNESGAVSDVAIQEYIAAGNTLESVSSTDTRTYTYLLGGSATESGSSTESQSNFFSTSTRSNERISKNRYLNSQDINLWGVANVTIVSNTDTDPLFGTQTVEYVSNTPSVNSAVNLPSIPNGSYQGGQTFTKSIYAKLITGSPNLFFQAITYLETGAFGAYQVTNFNLATGTVVSSTSGATSSMVSLGNGWYRCIQSFTVPTNNGAGNSNPIAGDSIFIGGYGNTPTATTHALWGAQLEFGSSATAYEYTGANASIGGSFNDANVSQVAFTSVSQDSASVSDSNAGLLTLGAIASEIATKNLVDYSEDFTKWTRLVNGATIISTNELAPDGTFTAVRIRPTALYSGLQTNTPVWLHDIPIVGSAWVKVDSGTRGLAFTLNGGGLTSNFTATSTWTRFNTPSVTKVANYNDRMSISDPNASGFVDYIVWGVQVEVGASVSAYQVKPIIESNAVQATFVSALSESGSATDADSAQSSGGTQTVLEVVSNTDSLLANLSAFSQSSEASGNNLDVSTNLVTFTLARSEPVTASETESSQANFTGLLTETGTANESELSQATFVAASSESATSADTSSKLVSFVTDKTEAGAASNSESALASLTSSLTETSSSNDIQSSNFIANKQIVESITSLDGLQAFLNAYVQSNETGSSLDTVNSYFLGLASRQETVTASDSDSAQSAATAYRLETGTATEVDSSQVVFVSSASENGISANDGITYIFVAGTQVITESASAASVANNETIFISYLGESVTANALANCAATFVADHLAELSISHVGSCILIGYPTQLEQSLATDGLIGNSTIQRSLTESVSPVELQSQATSKQSALQESVTTSSVAANQVVFLGLGSEVASAQSVEQVPYVIYRVSVVEPNIAQDSIFGSQSIRLVASSAASTSTQSLLIKTQLIDISAVQQRGMNADIYANQLSVTAEVLEQSAAVDTKKIYANVDVNVISASTSISYFKMSAQLVYTPIAIAA